MSIEPLKKNIRQMRTEAGISQSDMARMIGVNRNTIINYESGKTSPPLDVLMKILAVIEDKEQDYHDQSESLTDIDAPPDPTDAERAQQKARFDLLSAFDQLNPTGQSEAVNRVEEMTHIPKYTEGGEDHGSEA